jgi:cyclophilin family peptidyl-prolyl cis-trans isomerase
MRRAIQKQPENREIQESLTGGRSKNQQSLSRTRNQQSPTRIYYVILIIILTLIVIVLMVMTGLPTFDKPTMALQRQQSTAVMDQGKRTIRKLIKQPPPNQEHQQQQQQQTKDNDVVSEINSASSQSSSQQEVLVLTTEYGKIRILLQPDLSPGSVEYIHKLVESGVCRRCNFYRAEKPGILQGVMANPSIPINTVRGKCPEGLEDAVKNDCPDWDQHCGCHGPIMTQGAVGWAGGEAGGPDFFIDHYQEPAKFWGTQHTNFGRIQEDDHDSFAVIRRIFDLPVKNQAGMSMIETPIHFDLNIEPVGVEITADIVRHL